MSKIILRFFLYFGFAFLIGWFLIFSYETLFAQSVDETEKKLQEELKRVEQEIQQTQGVLNVQKSKSNTIEGQVNVLKSEINKAQSVINEKSSAISRLGTDINVKEQTVAQLNAKLERSREALAELIRATNKMDDISLPEIMVSYDNISDFFSVAETLIAVQRSLDNLFDQIRQLRGLTEEEKITLQEKKAKEADAKAVIESEKRKVEVKKGEQDSLLAVSKNVEKTYEQVLAEKQAKANAIRSALFKLRDGAGISFGEALQYANEASRATGVRAAFILAILKQESDLGKNVGTCNRPGDPEDKKWYNIMPGGPNDGWNSKRDDRSVFLRITKDLGLDPETTPLSCPWGTGWGGAMGPSQFIPTTWAAYESKIAAAVGVSTPNPWNPKHAFTATGIYVSELGAGAQTYTAEKTAALKYYAGGNWSLPQNQFYGNSVMNHATTFQGQIDFLKDVD